MYVCMYVCMYVYMNVYVCYIYTLMLMTLNQFLYSPGCGWFYVYNTPDCTGDFIDSYYYYSTFNHLCYSNNDEDETLSYFPSSGFELKSESEHYAKTYCSNGPSPTSICGGDYCPPYSGDVRSQLTTDYRDCKPGDSDKNGHIKALAASLHPNYEGTGLTYGAIQAAVELPTDSAVGDQFKFVLTYFDTQRRYEKQRYWNQTYELQPADLSTLMLDIQLFGPQPIELLEGKLDQMRIKMKRRDHSGSSKRDFERLTCARFGGQDDGSNAFSCEDEFGPQYSGTNCPDGCVCCRADGSCKECPGDHVCIVDSSNYGTCASCDVQFQDQADIDECVTEVGKGWTTNGVTYDNTCV